MNFPLELTAHINSHNGDFTRSITLNGPLTIILGPNGSGKTHVLRGLRDSLKEHVNGKKVRFLSAGRMGPMEQFRSDYNGHQGGVPNYDNATFGQKSDVVRRHNMETLSGDFHTLAERADILIKIQERLKKLFQRDVLVDWDGGRLKISFSRLDVESQPYSSGREASGLMHLVGILSALYDDEVGALLLDEPEVSLHPQLQAFLLKEILSVAGAPGAGNNKKIVVIATHSTEMLEIRSPGDLASLVFCYDLRQDPVQISPSAKELDNKKIRSLIARLGQEHKLSLFAKRPLLVEGPSDVIICSALAAKLGVHLEAAGSQLLPVIGKGQMPAVSILLRLLGKNPVVLVDADGVSDGLELINSFLHGVSDADMAAAALGFKSAKLMASGIISDFSSLVDNRWGEISFKAELHSYWISRSSNEDVQARRRSALCTLFIESDAALVALASDKAWINIKSRLSALFDLLERSGLFVLRKGSIESYYLSATGPDSIGKPNAAVAELEYINQGSRGDVEGSYSDVIRCIRYSASAESICEADSLRDLLLSVIAPAHARFKDGDLLHNFNNLCRQILGDRSKIFSLVVDKDELIVSIESNILDVRGFPLRIGRHDDVFGKINTALNLNSERR